jgi:hypothetical protein
VQLSLAHALLVDGEQSGKNESLAESIELYRKVLNENTRARLPIPLRRVFFQDVLTTDANRPAEKTGRLPCAVAAVRVIEGGPISHWSKAK